MENTLPKNFDWKFYLEYYEDLRNAGLKTEEQAKKHYLNNGQFEDRVFLRKNHYESDKNSVYDKLTEQILTIILKTNSNCIDVGCHKGEILKFFIELSPMGKHIAFEPIPSLYESLKVNFNINNVEIHNCALSNISHITNFIYVKNDIGYSGLKERKYNLIPQIEEIKVVTKTLDEVVSPKDKIDFIKIDVEGGEFDVLKGSKRILSNDKPFIIFEFGLGASDYYDVNPHDLFNFFEEFNYSIYTLDEFIKGRKKLSMETFIKIYNNNTDYYFLAKPN
jgi:FkbM family methyltransferase